MKISKTSRRWMVYTIFLFIAQLIYFQFSHGVSSLIMSGIWLPALIYLILSCFGIYHRFLAAGVATGIMGMFLSGIFQIAGTDSPFIVFYWLAAAVLLVLGSVNLYLEKI
jgi:hypothetical protein